MSQKKDDLPAMPFYVGDWLKAPDIQCLSYDLKGLWFEMLCYMWESKERGVLLYTREELCRLLRLPEDLLNQNLNNLEKKGIFSVREDGSIYSRKMVKMQEIREKRIISGQRGGFATQFAKPKVKANCENENENENENETVTKRTTKDILYMSIVEQWNQFAEQNKLSKIISLSKERKAKLKVRCEMETFKAFSAILEATDGQDFLFGKEGESWKLNFDWLIVNDTNHLKILEKKYENARKDNELPGFLREFVK